MSTTSIKVLQGLRGHKVLRARKGCRDSQAPQGRRDHRAHRERKARRDCRDHKVHKARRGYLESAWLLQTPKTPRLAIRLLFLIQEDPTPLRVSGRFLVTRAVPETQHLERVR